MHILWSCGLFRNPQYEALSPVGDVFSLIRQDFTLVTVRRESDPYFLNHMLTPQHNTVHALRYTAHSEHTLCNIITNTAQVQIPMHPHKLTHIHTLVVLSLLLVLTAHQSPVSACRNMLTSAISLKSLSIRSSCAGPSTLCKPRVRNPPTYIHTRLELTHRHPHLCAHKWEHILYAYTHMLTPILHKPYCIHTQTHNEDKTPVSAYYAHPRCWLSLNI